MYLAIDKIGTDSILPGKNVEVKVGDTHCDATEGLTAAMNIWKDEDDLDAFIGGGCSVVCEPVALISAVWNLPHVSWGCNSPDLSDKDKYPTFTRSVGPWSDLAPAVDKFTTTFNWNRVAILAARQNIMMLTAAAFEERLIQSGKVVFRHNMHSVIVHQTVNTGYQNDMKKLVAQIKTEARSEYQGLVTC